MNKWTTVFILVVIIARCEGKEPFKPKPGSIPFVVYYTSRYRGLCVGTLVSRTAVLTAAVCVTSPHAATRDTRPINVVLGATYRHPRRGIRVQVIKILIPNLTNMTGERGYLMSKSAALLLLRRKIPDILTEIPPRAIDVDYKGEEKLVLHEQCFMPGWHFFYKGDQIYPVYKFLLQRNIRVQFVNVVKKKMWCDALSLKFQKALSNLGFFGTIDTTSAICVRDVDRVAQPCHGMYGAPLICRGRAVGMLMAPDAQWTNCTGFSNMVHLLSSKWHSGFMNCVSSMFAPDIQMDWTTMKKNIENDSTQQDYDYVPQLYDKVIEHSSSSSE